MCLAFTPVSCGGAQCKYATGDAGDCCAPEVMAADSECDFDSSPPCVRKTSNAWSDSETHPPSGDLDVPAANGDFTWMIKLHKEVNQWKWELHYGDGEKMSIQVRVYVILGHACE